MSGDPFADSLGRVRARFVAKVEGQIDVAGAAVPHLSEVAPNAAAALADVYRSIHGIVGIARTVGFPGIGAAARRVEDALREAYSKNRGLTTDEVSLFTTALGLLRDAASSELQSLHTVGE